MSLLDREEDQALAAKPSEKGESLRSGVAHILFPGSPQEARKLNQFALLGVRVRARSELELPLEGVVLRREKSTEKVPTVQVLPRIFPGRLVAANDAASPMAKRFGRFLETAYYFVPLALLHPGSTLWAVSKDKKATLPLLTMPNPALPEGLDKESAVMPDPKAAPEPELAVALLNRNFCVFGVGKP